MQPHLYLDTPWYWYSRRYASAREGWVAWAEVEERLGGKNLDLGIYRHGPPELAGQFITVVSLRPQGVLQARRILRGQGGSEVSLGGPGLNAAELEALIARRIRAVAALAHEHPGESGTAVIHHLGRGREINPDGTYS